MSTNTETTAVANVSDIPKGVRGLLLGEKVRAVVQPFLPQGVMYDRVVASSHFAARQNPEINLCTTTSIVDAVCRILQWGLEIGLTAHLVPFNRKVSKRGEQDRWEKICTAVADYKGIAELMVASGSVRHVEAHVVFKGDDFDYEYGTNAYLKHKPTHAAKERGIVTHAYVLLRLPGNLSSFEVMGIEDIDLIRKKYSKQWKDGDCPGWYAKKTVVRQSAKLVPKDRRLAAVLAVIRQDEEQEFEATASEVLPPGSARPALSAGVQDEEITDTIQRKTGVAPLMQGGEEDPYFYDRYPEDDQG